ncbi:MAG: hypothetical protein KDA87_02750 [Planctomycetales bacterium]|nr:hypothetical protein [Planctomycetales bacterium]
MVDEAFYFVESPSPQIVAWPTIVAGQSWHRRWLSHWGSAAHSWTTNAPNLGERVDRAADLNDDGVLSVDDIDRFCEALHGEDRSFDFSGDGQIDSHDLTAVVEALLQTSIGDVNLDGVFNSNDLVLLFQTAKFEDEQPNNSSWADGDWNCDGDFNSNDLVFAFQRNAYSANAKRQ